MSLPPVVGAEVDVGRNLLRTRYAGHATKSDLEAGVSAIRTQMAQLKPGFTILADWSGIEGLALDCVPAIAEIMELARAHGAATVVRVLPDPARDIGINMLSVVHLRGTARTVTAENLEEAERLVR
jgi:hypothetical protein